MFVEDLEVKRKIIECVETWELDFCELFNLTEYKIDLKRVNV